MKITRTPACLIVILLLALAVAGCTVRMGDFTLASTRNIGQLSQKGDQVEGEDCANYLFAMIPLGNLQANAKTAVDRALERAKGDVLADGVFWRSFFIIPYVWMQECYRVEGKVARGEFAKK